MNLGKKLQIATQRAQQEDDLPDFLADRVYAIAEQVSNRSSLNTEIEELVDQLSLYDTYGQTGYIGMGVNNSILENTIKRIEQKLLESPTETKEPL